MLRFAVYFLLVCGVSTSAYANYPGMTSSAICNGYSVVTGQVTKINSVTAYDGYEATWIEVTNPNSRSKFGGRLYFREPVAAGYEPMVNSARLAFITGANVNVCISGDDIYAVELFQ